MRTDKSQALKLRLKGKSYNEITELLGVPKSTLSNWFASLVLSTSTQDKINKRTHKSSVQALIKRNKRQTILAKKRAQQIQTESCAEIDKLTNRELLLLGSALYWAEGYKRPIIKNGKPRSYHQVSLTNTDPKLVLLFIEFLRVTCNVPNEKIIASVRIYQHHNEAKLLNFWATVTKIPVINFRQFYYGISKSSQGKRPYNILPYGTIQIAVYDTKIYHKIMGWIQGLSKLY